MEETSLGVGLFLKSISKFLRVNYMDKELESFCLNNQRQECYVEIIGEQCVQILAEYKDL